MRNKLALAVFTISASTLHPAVASDTWTKSDVVTLDQGWSEQDRSVFYHAPQGSPIMPYAFFMALEQKASDTLFTDEAHLKRLGMLYWGKSDLNPDGLPIGLTVDLDIHGVEPFLGMNCAACHVTEVKVGGATTLIDGGVSHFDFWTFMTELLGAIEETHDDDAKFARFADRVLGADVDDESMARLKARLRGVMRMRQDWAFNNAVSSHPGPGRVDALNVILNQVTAKMLNRPDNARPVDAPVSFPFLWDAPYLDFVQYNGVVPNGGVGALGRNVGQVLGVFGQVALEESVLPGGYASSVRIGHLQQLEKTLETLTSPQWSEMAEKGLLPPVQADLEEQGKAIYDSQCAACHLEIDRENRGELASIPVKLLPLPQVGTDPTAAMGFAARLVASGPLEGRKEGYVAGEPMCEYVHGNSVLAHVTVGVIMNDLGTTYKPVLESVWDQAASGVLQSVHDAGSKIKGLFGFGESAEHKKVLTDQQLIAQMQADGDSESEIVAALKKRSDNAAALYDLLIKDGLAYHGQDAACLETLETAQYRARPLDGVWATGPFLHNGSVMSLAELLKPVAERRTSFIVGQSEFDPVNIGFSEPADGKGYVLDTQVSGNSNAGHTYGVDLTASDKLALLEYLKTL